MNGKGFSTLIVLLIVLGVIVVAGWVYLGMQKSSNSTYPVNNNFQQPVISPKPTAISSASIQVSSWKIYTNSDIPFQISYPSSWQVKEHIDSTTKVHTVNFTGNEGSIDIEYGDIIFNNCPPDDFQPYSMDSQGLGGCNLSQNGMLSLHLYKVVHNTLVFQINGQTNSTNSSNNQLVQKILSSVSFSK